MSVILDIDSAKGIIVVLVALVSTILIVGGNVLTIMAIIKRQKLATPSNQFIIGLALADLLVGVTMPYCTVTFYLKFDVSKSYGLFAAKCLLANIPLLMSCYSSFFHIFAIAVDRYLSLMYPLEHKVHLTGGRARIVIALLWCLSTSLATMPIYWNRNYLGPEIDSCLIRTMPYDYFTFIMWPMFVIFIAVFVMLYVRIWCIASKRASDVKKPLKMVGLVISCTIVCWTPLVVSLFFKLDLNMKINETFLTSTYFLVVINSFANPIIYAWKNKDFRRTFIEFLRCNVAAEETLNKSFEKNHKYTDDEETTETVP